MKIQVYVHADAVALAAAKLIAKEARDAFATRGKFVMAVSGGKTPWVMLRDLAQEYVPWKGVHVVQVDERVAPERDPDRNLTHLLESLLEHAPLRPDQIHAMPVESGNLEAACAQYTQILRTVAGSPPVLDPVHLGLGPDGTPRVTGTWRPGPRCERCRGCTHGNLPEPAAHDADLPDHQPFPSRVVAGDRSRKG